MNAAALIFSNIHDSAIPELTSTRTMASVPFAGRYRLIDFALSNIVNADIEKVGIITHYNYHSLVEHIGNGKDWDLARRAGGIKILSPFITAFENNVSRKVYSTRLEALYGVMSFINNCKEKYIVLTDSDLIVNIDLKDVVSKHEKSGADLTIVTASRKAQPEDDTDQTYILDTNSDGRVTTARTIVPADYQNEANVSLNIFVFNKNYLAEVLLDGMAHGYRHFYTDLVRNNLEKSRIMTYTYDGYYARISSLVSYYKESLRLLEPEVRNSIFKVENRSIYTKIRNTAPTSYHPGSSIKNSLIADGCVIEGTVENSIIFRGVKVGKGSVVRNSIVLQDSYIGNNVSLDCVLSDKNVVIRDGVKLSGHETLPFFIKKRTMI